MPSPSAVVYIDGFNLYYGAVKGTPYKWLDLDRHFSLLRRQDDVRVIKYFTSLVSGPTRPNQDVYLAALATSPRVQVVLGKFKEKTVKCQVPTCTTIGPRHFTVREEKRTDVNIAVHMLDDAVSGCYEKMILVSGDSDLVPAVSTVRQRFARIEVSVYVPAISRKRGFATELRNAANKHDTLPNHLLSKAQFPDPVIALDGTRISKPAAWSTRVGGNSTI